MSFEAQAHQGKHLQTGSQSSNEQLKRAMEGHLIPSGQPRN